MQIHKEIVVEMTVSLKQSHKGKVDFHQTMLEKYRKEYQRYEARIEVMYEDKLNGSITESFYNKKREEYRLKQKEITQNIARLSGADEEYYITSEYLLQLANRAYDLFMSSEAEEKRQLFKTDTSELKIEG